MTVSYFIAHRTAVQKVHYRTSLAVQWLRLCASTAGGAGSIPGHGTKILHAMQHGQNQTKPKQNKTKSVLEILFKMAGLGPLLLTQGVQSWVPAWAT